MARRKRIGGSGVFAQINVTPLVDVMLVLLVVFMITAPLMSTTSVLDIPLPDEGVEVIEGAPELFVVGKGEWLQKNRKGRPVEAREFVGWL